MQPAERHFYAKPKDTAGGKKIQFDSKIMNLGTPLTYPINKHHGHNINPHIIL